MKSVFRKFVLLLFAVVMFLAGSAFAADVPTVKVGYIFTTHHTPLMVAALKGEALKSQGVYLKPVVTKDKYELIENGKTVAVLQFIVAKSGAETASLFARNHLDLAMASVTAMMAGIDKGTPIKILSPLQTEGMALVAPPDSSLRDWPSLTAFVKKSNKPVKIGYHSPTSAPKIVLEGALKQAGIKVTENPNDASAQVLLADLKETTNLLPALSSKQVDAVVGPSPFPEVAVSKKIGKIVADLGDLPPSGAWRDFPCCVTVANSGMISSHPEVVQAFVALMARTNIWCNTHKEDSAFLAAEWIGISREAALASSLVYLPKFSDQWMRNTGVYMGILNNMGKFSGQLKDKNIGKAKAILFDMRFIDNVKL